MFSSPAYDIPCVVHPATWGRREDEQKKTRAGTPGAPSVSALDDKSNQEFSTSLGVAIPTPNPPQPIRFLGSFRSPIFPLNTLIALIALLSPSTHQTSNSRSKYAHHQPFASPHAQGRTSRLHRDPRGTVQAQALHWTPEIKSEIAKRESNDDGGWSTPYQLFWCRVFESKNNIQHL